MNEIAAFFDTMATEWDAICCHNPEKIRTILSLPACYSPAASW